MSWGRRSLDLELPRPAQIVKLFTNSTPRADFHDMLMVCPTSPRYTQSVENLHFGVRNFAPLPARTRAGGLAVPILAGTRVHLVVPKVLGRLPT